MAAKPNPNNKPLNTGRLLDRKRSQANHRIITAEMNKGKAGAVVETVEQAVQANRRNISTRDVTTYLGRVVKVYNQIDSRMHLRNIRPELSSLSGAELDKFPPCIKIRVPLVQGYLECPDQLWSEGTSDRDKLLIELDPVIYAPMYSTTNMMYSPQVGDEVEAGFLNQNGMKCPVYYRPLEASNNIIVPVSSGAGSSAPTGGDVAGNPDGSIELGEPP